MSEQFIVEQLEILNDENDFKGEYWWAVTNTERIEDCFECRNKEVAIELCAFLNKATDDFKWLIRHSEKWSARCKQLEREVDEQQSTIEKQNELIKLIANACTYSKEHSVKEILRKEIKGIDTVTYESADAWHDYVILSEFFKEHYKEHWDNE